MEDQGSVCYASQMIYCRVSQDKWNMSILSHLDLVIIFFSMISILAVFTLLFCCSVCSGEARSWAPSKIRVVLRGEKLQLKGHFLYGRFSTLGQRKQRLWMWLVGSESTMRSRLAWVTKCGNVLTRWQSGYRRFSVPGNQLSWWNSPHTVSLSCRRSPVLSYEFSVHEIKMGSWCSCDTLLIYAATKTKPNRICLCAVIWLFLLK